MSNEENSWQKSRICEAGGLNHYRAGRENPKKITGNFPELRYRHIGKA
jgi:hypothetical protein